MQYMSNNENIEVSQQHAIIDNQTTSPQAGFIRTTHPDAQWFPQAGLGLFIHWGISSVLGQYDLSWGMMKRKEGGVKAHIERYGLPAISANVSPRKYWEQAKYFNPEIGRAHV